MDFLHILGLAIALAMDALAVATAIGVRLHEVSRRQIFRLSWHFGLFQALMPVLGWHAGVGMRSYIARFDHWVAFGLLLFVGGHMVWDGIQDTAETETAPPKDPTRGMSLVLLSIATSIDALAVGFSLSMLQISIVFPAVIIGVVALALTIAGMVLGAHMATGPWLRRYSAIVGGLILLLIAVRILIIDAGPELGL
ncbi:MAG TPA: manganese efflux pump [Verrucomicrobia bacterium]|jgi:putative Mn2+ efflux pump MntP|nr:manganese efflux pump [Verrucomicrobiota bacterium]